MSFRKYVTLYVLFCLVGAGLEWSYGKLWGIIGTAPWKYADSPLYYTSLETVPLWGFGGLICVSIYQSFSKGKLKPLLGLIPSLILAAAWIVVYTQFVA